MTTTACDDQFSAEPEPDRQPYDVAAILRKNVADLEKDLQRQKERAEKAEKELKAAQEQKPAIYMAFSECGQFIRYWTQDTKNLDATMAVHDFEVLEFYARPIPAPAPAPAVPEEWLKCWLIERPASSEWPAIWLTITTDGRRWVSDGGTMYATGGDWYFTSSASEALKFADKESADEYVRHNKIKDVVVTEHIFYDRALLQSANHSEQALEKVAPDCLACANRGRVNGLSQESYCDSCIYQGRDWRQNHFVDAVKRRCEACAILPCSCK